MKIVLKTVSVAIVTFLFLFVTQFALDVSAFGMGKSEFRYLILGLDDAADNSDSILIVTYNGSDNTASVIQLPRDTYCKSESKSKKINSVYATFKASGFSDKSALQKTAYFISEKLGISFDGCLALRLADLEKLVDALGGIKMVLPHDLAFYDKSGNCVRSFYAGENVLTGADAAFFVRYRAGYANGDLGRLDAQKVFMNALFDTVMHNIGVDELFDMVKIFSDTAVTNIKIREILGMVLKHSSKFKDTFVTYLTMPGKAVCDKNGVWYYALNRSSSADVLYKYTGTPPDYFDKSNAFLNEADKQFFDIYFSEKIKWKEYHSHEPQSFE